MNLLTGIFENIPNMKEVYCIYLFIGHSYNTVHKISDEELKKSGKV